MKGYNVEFNRLTLSEELGVWFVMSSYERWRPMINSACTQPRLAFATLVPRHPLQTHHRHCHHSSHPRPRRLHPQKHPHPARQSAPRNVVLRQ